MAEQELAASALPPESDIINDPFSADSEHLVDQAMSQPYEQEHPYVILPHPHPEDISLEAYTDHLSEVCHMSPQEYQTKMKQLSKSQTDVVKYFQRKIQDEHKSAFHLFITGGTGKTFLTEVLIAYLNMYIPSVNGKAVTKVCAPTGAAATHIIGGQTIHSMLKIPITLADDLLSSKYLKELRMAFTGCHTIFIDEISMVGEKTSCTHPPKTM